MVEGEETETTTVEAEPADDVQASPLSININWGQKRQINRNAADFGAIIGRPVSVAEFARERLLEPVKAA